MFGDRVASYSNIKDLLEAAGHHLTPARGDEYRLHCIFCDDSARHAGHLYVNAAENLYYCQKCGEKGNGKTLARHLGEQWIDGEESGLGTTNYFTKLIVNNMAMDYYHFRLLENEEVYLYLRNERGFTKETIERAHLGYAPTDYGLVPYLKDHGIASDEMKATGLVSEDGREFLSGCITIPYLSAGQCVQIRGRTTGRGAKYLTPGGQDARLYGLDTIKEAEEVIICEGEFDALAGRQMGFSVVGVPGAKNFKEEWVPWLEGYRRIYICYDSEESGRGDEGADRLKSMIGRRVRVVHLPRPKEVDKVDLNDYFHKFKHTYEEFLDLLHQSEGKKLLRPGEVRRRWLENKGLDDGIYPNLVWKWDNIIRPGFQRGQVVTLLAKTGAGKSLAILNIAYQNRKVVPQIMVSLELTAEEVYERMRRISLFFDPTLTDDEIDEEWSNLLICDENRLTGKDFEDLIFEFEEEMGVRPHLVYVDYLGYFARSYRGEEYSRLSDAIMDLKRLAKRHKVVIFTPHQVNRSGKDGRPLEADMARGSGVIEETSDFCFALWRPGEADAADDSIEPGEVLIRILKSRHGGKGQQFKLLQAPQSLAYIQPDNLSFRNAVMNEFHCVEQKDMLWDEIHEIRRGRLTGLARTSHYQPDDDDLGE